MTKQKKIKEAYGENWEKVKDFVDIDEGWCTDKYHNKIDCPLPKGDIEYISRYIRADDGERMVDVYQWMPKSLEGIENNNGWVKIENEEQIKDFQNEFCWVVMNNGIMEKIYIHSSNYKYLLHNASHYQLIPKPKPPIH